MFNFIVEDFYSRFILDCLGGVCLFSSYVCRYGVDFMVVDIVYEYEIDKLEFKGQQDVEYIIE